MKLIQYQHQRPMLLTEFDRPITAKDWQVWGKPVPGHVCINGEIYESPKKESE